MRFDGSAALETYLPPREMGQSEEQVGNLNAHMRLRSAQCLRDNVRLELSQQVLSSWRGGLSIWGQKEIVKEVMKHAETRVLRSGRKRKV